VQRVQASAGDLQFSSRSGTYPDDLFSSVLADDGFGPDLNQVLLDEPGRTRRFAASTKRTVDIVGALLGIAAFAPIMLLAALAIALTSPGPIIFQQVRVGQNGARFVFYKFRSMYRDADERVHREYVTSLISATATAETRQQPARAWSKLSGDPRITPVGRFLRRTSIDELPQLFNVLKGDLSLVGPRPALPYEVEKYQPWHLRRVFAAKPGISGPWQVTSRGRATFDEMVRMDLGYAKKWSLGRDFKIMAKTLLVVVKRSGAG
jgi:lipopolysaccharide/colanic/teichoic acid biosynthesis glycosyltransferase